MAEALAKQPRPAGPRLTIVTNAGGPGVLATDMLIGSGGQLAELSAGTIEEFNKFLPGPGAIKTRSTSLATPAPTATPRRCKSPPPIRAATACWSS